MNPPQIHLLRKSFAAVEARGCLAALVFYRLLFARHPELRPLFKGGIEEQAAKLTAMLGALLSLLERGDALLAELEEMGARHAEYGVRDAHYTAVGDALLAMLAEVLDDDFTPATEAAWSALYHLVEQAMKRGAARAACAAR